MQPNSLRPLYLLISITLIFALISCVIGLLQLTGTPSIGMGSKDEVFFDSQNANVGGKITAVNGNMITFQNKKGLKKQFKLSNSVIIGPAQVGTIPTSLSDPKNIEIGKDVAISLTSNNGVMEVNSIFPVMPLAPAQPPAPQGNAKTGNSASNSAVLVPPTQITPNSTVAPASSAKPTK